MFLILGCVLPTGSQPRGFNRNTQVALSNSDSQRLTQRCGVWGYIQVRQKTAPGFRASHVHAGLVDLLLKEAGGRQKYQRSEAQEGRETFPATDGPQLCSGSRMQKRLSKIEAQQEASDACTIPHKTAIALTRKTLLIPLSTQTLLKCSVDSGGGGGRRWHKNKSS